MANGILPVDSPAQLTTNSCSETHNNNTRLPNMNTRRSELTLPLNQMAIPVYTAPPSQEEVEVSGQLFFQSFVHEALEQEGLPDITNNQENLLAFGDIGPVHFPAAVHRSRPVSPSTASTPDGYTNMQFRQIGANITRLAQEFDRSRERTLIHQQADQVDLNRINQETFNRLLEEVFRNGVDKTRLIALFFFCSDVLIRCLRREMIQLGTDLFLWSSRYVIDRVCRWVYENGGWAKVMGVAWHVTQHVVYTAMALVLIACGVVYLKKNY